MKTKILLLTIFSLGFAFSSFAEETQDAYSDVNAGSDLNPGLNTSSSDGSKEIQDAVTARIIRSEPAVYEPAAVQADSTAPNQTAPAMDPVMMEKMKAAMTPGEPHKVLGQFVGNWNYTAKFWMAPDQPAQESTGTSRSEVIYGGRFVKDTVSGTWAGEPFEGTGYTGYDNMRGEYQSIWMDSSMTGMMSSTGQYDAAAKTLNLSGVASCPMTGEKNKACRSETTIVDEDHYTMTSYTAGPDGNEMKAMELSFTRA